VLPLQHANEKAMGDGEGWDKSREIAISESTKDLNPENLGDTR
jgi:hypothetical protein